MSIETLGLAGAETVVLQLSEELRRRGHTVLPIGPGGRDGWLRRTMLERGFSWAEYQLRRPIDWKCAEQFARLLHDLRADVSHAHEFTASVYGAAAAQLAGIPHVITMHGNQTMTGKLTRRLALRWAFRRASATTAVSLDTCAHLEASLGLRPGAVQLVRNGVPIRPGNRDATRRALGVGSDDLLVLAVGSLVPRKGHRVLLEAMARIATAGGTPSWRVAIAGEGTERAALESQIRALGMDDRAQLLGNRQDVPDLQAAADIFVMPSLWEGLPLAVLEAMFAGNPIVATTASGIPEAVTQGEEGLLVEAGNVEELAAALRRLILDAAERTRLGTRARARAERDFSIGVMADAYERMYAGT